MQVVWTKLTGADVKKGVQAERKKQKEMEIAEKMKEQQPDPRIIELKAKIAKLREDIEYLDAKIIYANLSYKKMAKTDLERQQLVDEIILNELEKEKYEKEIRLYEHEIKTIEYQTNPDNFMEFDIKT